MPTPEIRDARVLQLRRIRMTGPISREREAEAALRTVLSGHARWDGPDARLSHEFGTPLNAILGNVELMLDGSTGPLSQQARDCLADVQTAGQDLLRQSRLLLLLIQALACPAPTDEQAIPLEDLFGTAAEEAHRARDRVRIDARYRSARLIGDPFWLRTLARCLVDLLPPAEHSEHLHITVEQPTVLSIGWPGLHLAAVPASARALICRIVETHGGRMHHAIDRTFDLSWPASRLCAGPRTGPDADNRILQP